MTAPRQVAGALAACLTAGGIAWLLGVPPDGSLLVALLVAALVPVLVNPVEGTQVLPPLPVRMRHGARVEVSRLSWAMAGRRGRVDARVVRRLRTTARRRLSAMHLDPESPEHALAAERALGSWAYGVVVSDRTELTHDEVVRLVDAIERLGSLRHAVTPSRGEVLWEPDK